MKAKVILLGLCGAMLVSSCGSVGGSAATGGYLGGMFGSAIGGLSGGWRGHNIGTVVGMATGAVVGAAVGAAEEQKRERQIQEYHNRVAARQSYRQSQYQNNYEQQYDDSGYDGSNSGDDRLYDFNPSENSGYTGNSGNAPQSSYHGNSGSGISASALEATSALDIRNARFEGSTSRNMLSRKESGKIIFEIKNVSSRRVTDVVPTVIETTGNKRLMISPTVHIESIAPGQTIRYTAMVQATGALKDGFVNFEISTSHGNIKSLKTLNISVETRKN